MEGGSHPLTHCAVVTTLCSADPVPGGDASIQDALTSSPVEVPQDLWAHSKLFEIHEMEHVLLGCLKHAGDGFHGRWKHQGTGGWWPVGFGNIKAVFVLLTRLSQSTNLSSAHCLVIAGI